MRKAISGFLWCVTLAAIIVAGAAFCWLAIGVADDKDGGWLAVGVTLAVGVGAAVSQFVLAPKPAGSMRRPFWISWKGLATLFLACVAGAGAMSLLLPLLDPPVATERTVTDDGDRTRVEIDRAKNEIIAALSPAQRAVVEAIPGLWGEAGCRVVYHFQVRDGGLSIERIRKEPGMADYAMTAALVPGGVDDQLHASVARSSDHGETEGQALIFSYARAGAEERLNWRNLTHGGYGGTKLERCR